MRGFTLIELMVVIGLSAILAGLSIAAASESFTRTMARADASTLLTTLLEARAASMDGVLQKVFIDATHQKIVFASLSGTIATDTVITITNGTNTYSYFITTEGRISTLP